MKQDYFTIEVFPDELNKKLTYYGSYGWSFKQLIVMQRNKPKAVLNNSVQPYEIEIKFLLIFEKPCQE